MLDRLAQVRWNELTTAYGDASNVPAAIAALMSEKPSEWVEAISFLYDHLCHQQCTVYEATGSAVPFLVECLGKPEVKCRARILELLADIAAADSYLRAHGELNHYNDKRDTFDFQQQLVREIEWVVKSREEVWRGLEAVIRLLAHDDRKLRVSVPFFLSRLAKSAKNEVPQDVARTHPIARMSQAMAGRLEWEAEPLVRASLVFGLKDLCDEFPENHDQIVACLDDSEFCVRLAAAICLCEIRPERVGAEAVDILKYALLEVEATDRAFDSDEPGIENGHHPLVKAYADAGMPLGEVADSDDDYAADEDYKFPWRQHRTQFDIVEAVCRLPQEHLSSLFPLLKSRIDAANQYTADSILPPILRCLFQGDTRAGDETGELSGEQRDALLAVYNNLSLWLSQTHVASAWMVTGLSDDRNEWRRVLRIADDEFTVGRAAEILDAAARECMWPRPAANEPMTDRVRRKVTEIVLRNVGTDVFVPLLQRFPLLERLDLCGCRISANALKTLPRFNRLKSFHATGVEISLAAAEHLARFKKLSNLNLSHTNLNDEMLKRLLPLRRLTEIGLFNTRVTSAATDILIGFPNLKRLHIKSDTLSETAIQRLLKGSRICEASLDSCFNAQVL